MAIDTLRSAAHLQRELGDELFSTLISSDNTAAVKQFLLGLQPLLTLTPAGIIKVRSVEKFVANEFFQVNTKKNAPVNIPYIGNNFKEWFLSSSASEEATTFPGAGPYCTPAVQQNVTEVGLRYHTLNKRSVDGPIIEQLGGEAKAETTLAEIAACMKKQASGKAGALLTNGYANIFYVRDAILVLRAVFVRWDDDGWGVYAYSVEYPGGWCAGRRVFSRDS
jgi:hypothetical protein